VGPRDDAQFRAGRRRSGLRRAWIGLALAVLAGATVRSHGHPRGHVTATVAGKALSIRYARPALRGRDMAALLPPEQLWRMGADEPTLLTTEADLSFGPTQLPRGEYVLLGKRRTSGEWVLVIGRLTTKWVWSWPPHRVTDIVTAAEIPLVPSELPESVELMTIELAGEAERGEFRLSWGRRSLSASFTGR
jgi:hypothetical protein